MTTTPDCQRRMIAGSLFSSRTEHRQCEYARSCKTFHFIALMGWEENVDLERKLTHWMPFCNLSRFYGTFNDKHFTMYSESRFKFVWERLVSSLLSHSAVIVSCMPDCYVHEEYNERNARKPDRHHEQNGCCPCMTDKPEHSAKRVYDESYHDNATRRVCRQVDESC